MSLPDPIDPPAAVAFRGDAVIGTVVAVAGLRHGRALVALVASLFIGVLASGLFSRLGLAGALFGALLFLVAAAIGVNAAGLLQLDTVRGAAPRRLADALGAGVRASRRFCSSAPSCSRSRSPCSSCSHSSSCSASCR